MSLTTSAAARRSSVVWIVAIQTLASIVISVAIVAGVLLLLFGWDADAALTRREFWTLALSFAIGIPAIACPVVGTRMLLLLRDLKVAKEELSRLADTDQLTALLNRRGFEKAAAGLLADAERTGTPVAVLMCDIDHFKSINDTHGHDFGDQALKHVAEVIRTTLGAYGVVAGRFGGEEFVALLPDTSTARAKLAAEELRIACALKQMDWDGKQARITMSVGIAAAAHPQSDLARLITHADTALYRAKRSGRNRVEASQLETVATAA